MNEELKLYRFLRWWASNNKEYEYWSEQVWEMEKAIGDAH